ncbi:amino acid permease [Pseudomonas tolaasii]|uniref:Amino acid permease n=2 Tax=Pseudomonas tolaasii TaxID=29442 RepID=A0A7Y8DUA4_PSETO|nr:GABA permease [Pseudomonas tolaasii]PKA78610.1 gamma-aminobutyrate:proton symporter, AAT family [Pseudomonas tolaasii NCPPB 2192]KAB0466574.1 amino acid permease [Pseudomonas tolaasii]MBY8943437.1 amino acid permease [Pseudomonas tolaasii]NVZ45469.1 amino acid permease [Pseudomonas tolaasii]
MLSIAGVIGGGLFSGSGHAIAAAGPAAILAYMMAGALVVLVMRMLDEMAIASPDTGSFSTYADRAIGPWAGFTIGWLYWWFWVLVIPLEAIAAAAVLNTWFPGIETWVFAFSITALLTITNLFRVGKYGEFEFWFAMLKVIAIIAFIVLGGLVLFDFLPNREVIGLSTLVAQNGGFMPNGFGAVIGALLTTMFSFISIEAVTIAAAESKDPARNIAKATRSVIWRICLFYLVSIFVIISIVAWNDPQLPVQGSYQRALEIMNIPHAKFLVDIVVLVAVSSCLNSAIYISSRMVFSLAKRGDAPSVIRRTTRKDVPAFAVVASTVIGLLTTALNFFAPSEVFGLLLASSGAIALLVYLVIAMCQLRMRYKLERSNTPIALKMWMFLVLTWLAIGFIVAALTTMVVLPEHRSEVTATGLLTLLTVALGLISQNRRKTKNSAGAQSALSN